jgi:hypothetical protein
MAGSSKTTVTATFMAMKRIIVLLFVLLVNTWLHAQSAEDSVKATVRDLFDAMRTSDAEKLKQSFADSALLQTIAVAKNGMVSVKTETVADFAAQVRSIPRGDCDERIVFDVVRTDANLAMAWTPYEFYYKGKFSHCGVNSFQLVRINGSWKIQYIIDTRRKQCK